MKIGLLVGREGTFPQALLNEINGRQKAAVAEYVRVGGVRMAELCPYDVGGWRGVSKIHDRNELMEKYDQSGTDCMVLQQFIPFDHYVRSYCIGKKEVWPMPYDPIFRRYLVVDGYLTPALDERVRRETILINQALGYDINTVEFAIADGIPYAIDYMNPAPDADWWSVGTVYFKWMVEKVADLAIDAALNGDSTIKSLRWNDLLNSRVDVDHGIPAGAD